MTRRNPNSKYIDFHCHCLPAMDFDGTRDESETAEVCKLLGNQGVAEICATPHFYPQNESIDSFLSRRAVAFEKLMSFPSSSEFPKITLGAEVHIFREMCDFDIGRMAIGRSRCVLFELPSHPYKEWMYTVIENAAYKYRLVPIMAHIERFPLLSDAEIAKFASLPGVIFQVTVSSFKDIKILHKIDKICRQGVPVVFSSDAHNMSGRKPDFDYLTAVAGKFALPLSAAAKRKKILSSCLSAQRYLYELINK